MPIIIKKPSPRSKIEVAYRQLREAILLRFERRDPVSVHTLACAAAAIISDLLRNHGLPSPLIGMDLIREDRRREVQEKIREAQNFYKHADRDPEAMLEDNPEHTTLILFGAIVEYQILTDRSFRAADVFLLSFFFTYPDVAPPQFSEVASKPDADVELWTTRFDLLAELAIPQPASDWPDSAPSPSVAVRMSLLLKNMADSLSQSQTDAGGDAPDTV